MKRTVKYTNEPIGRLEFVRDFLPPPDQLVLKEDGVKVTLSLSKRSLIDSYAAQHGATSNNRIERRRER